MVEQVSTRRLRVLKCRGSNFGRNEYPYVITNYGLKVVPISRMGLQHKVSTKKVSSGNQRFDDILNGGVICTSAILFTGEPGTGKTILASNFTLAACNRDEKVLFISFEESEQAIINTMLSPGIDLAPAVTANKLKFLTRMPESMGAEEHLIEIIDMLDSFKPKHIIIDSISACERMGGKKASMTFLIRLLDACKIRGCTTIFTNQTDGRIDKTEISGIGISSLIDTVVLLKYVENKGETNRTIEVMKMRGSQHSNQIREFLISNEGLSLNDVYIGRGGVYTGQAREEQEALEKMEARRNLALVAETEVQLTLQEQLREAEKNRLEKTAEAEMAKLNATIMATQIRLENLQAEQGISSFNLETRATARGKNTDSSRLESSSNTSKDEGKGV